MSAERAGSLEGLAALLALEHLLRGVHGPVLRETDFVAEGFIAQLAGERPFAVVRPPRVHLCKHNAYSHRYLSNIMILCSKISQDSRGGLETIYNFVDKKKFLYVSNAKFFYT